MEGKPVKSDIVIKIVPRGWIVTTYPEHGYVANVLGVFTDIHDMHEWLTEYLMEDVDNG